MRRNRNCSDCKNYKIELRSFIVLDYQKKSGRPYWPPLHEKCQSEWTDIFLFMLDFSLSRLEVNALLPFPGFFKQPVGIDPDMGKARRF